VESGLCGTRPRAALRHTQLTPKLVQGHRWADRPSWWHLCETIFKKGQTLLRRGGGGKRVINSRCSNKMRGGGGGASWQSWYPLQPVEDPMLEQVDIPKGTGLWREQRKSVRRKEQQRNHCVLAVTPTPCTFVALLRTRSVTCGNGKGGGEESAVEERRWAWERERRGDFPMC